MSKEVFRLTVLLLCAAMLSSSCATPDAETYFTQAKAYIESGKDLEAIVELRSAVQIDPQRGDIRLALAEAYQRIGDERNALDQYVRAADLRDGDTDLQVKVGNLLLMNVQLENAKGRADKALAIDSTHVGARILRGTALAGLRDIDGAIEEYTKALGADPSRDDAYISLGALQASRGKSNESESLLKKGVEMAPKSVQPRLALADFYWSVGRRADAERTLKETLPIEPKNLSIHRALATLYVALERPAEAEPHIRLIAETSKELGDQLALVRYFVLSNRLSDARRLIEALGPAEESSRFATLALAALDADAGKRDIAHARIREVLADDVRNPSALLLQANLLYSDRKYEEALASVQRVVTNDPRMAAAHLLAGKIYIDTNRHEQAIAAYEEALKEEPRSLAAALELGRLHFSAGRLDKALTYSQQALTLQPASVEARALLARVYLQTGDLGRARTEVANLEKAAPNSPRALILRASLLEAEKKPDSARAVYARALDSNPRVLEAIQGITRIDLAAGRKKEAITRLEAATADSQASLSLILFAAQTFQAMGDFPKASTLANRAIALDRWNITAQMQLGNVYLAQRRFDEARQQFTAALERQPNSVQAATAMALTFEVQGNRAEAEKHYRKVLAIDSTASVAANNLAYLYASEDRNLDEALQLARAAMQAAPDDPTVSDTLGWIYVKQNLLELAVGHLETAAKKLPDNPAVHYHLGVAYLQVGETEKARRALKTALGMKSDFDGANDARRQLASLN
jgi:tetratricopeptide (TPR) repeat protein